LGRHGENGGSDDSAVRVMGVEEVQGVVVCHYTPFFFSGVT